jgi:hypothetical protein
MQETASPLTVLSMQVPQHISQVPNLRSPPPPASQNSYGQQSPTGQGGAAANPYMAQFGGFMSDPTAQMGLQMGQGALKVGQEYVEQNVRSVIQTASPQQEQNSMLTRRLCTVQPLRQRLGPQTLLQRLKPLRALQTPHSPLSMATQTMVAATNTLDRPLTIRHGRLPTTTRRCQQPGYVYSAHGVHHVCVVDDADCGIEWKV